MIYVLHASTSRDSAGAQSRLAEAILRGYGLPHRVINGRSPSKLFTFEGRRRTMGVPRVFLEKDDGTTEHIGTASTLTEHLNREYPELPRLETPTDSAGPYSDVSVRTVNGRLLSRAWLASPARRMQFLLTEREYFVASREGWETIVREISSAHGHVDAGTFMGLVWLHYQVNTCALIVDYGENRSYNGVFVDNGDGVSMLCCDLTQPPGRRIHALSREIANGVSVIG